MIQTKYMASIIIKTKYMASILFYFKK